MMKKFSFGVVSILLLGTASLSPAQWALQSGPIEHQIRRGIELTYNMDYAQADQTFDSVIAADPAHPSGYFFKAMVNFWRAITNTDNTGYDEAYRQMLDEAITRADGLLEANEYDLAGLFYKGASLGMRARIFAIRPNWQDAIGLLLGDAKEGIRYLNMLEEVIPSNGDILFGRGLYNFYVEAVKQDNPSLASLIGFFAEGNRRAGLQMLELASNRAYYSKTEAQYELMKIYYLYEKDYHKSYKYAQMLTSQYPNNSNFLHYLGFNQVSLNLRDGYDSTYRIMLSRAKARKEGYTIKQAREAMYFIGQAQLQNRNGNVDSALYYLYNSNLMSRKITPNEVTWWIPKSELLLGMAYDLRGDRKNALMMYDRVLKMKDMSGTHAEAIRYQQTPYKR
jgi:tetratricopeptide (TPR) repeat protein